MRSSRSQMQPFARHWPSGKPSVTAMLVCVSLVAALVHWSFLLLEGADLVAPSILDDWFALHADSVQAGRPWQLFTFVLLHHPLGLLANMLVLYFAGREVEPILGLRHFAGLYLLGNVLGGLAQWGAMALGIAPAATVIGVSAGAAAVLAAFATILPELEVVLLLFFVLP